MGNHKPIIQHDPKHHFKLKSTFILITIYLATTIHSQGQFVLPPGHQQQPHQPIKNTIGGVYSSNATLYFMNSPYRINKDLIVEHGVTLHIQTGVQMFFDTGIGLKVYGAIEALGNEFAHIQMLPYQQKLFYDYQFPDFRLIDGPTVRQGRLQFKVKDRWRSVCTALTNWTAIDTGAACKSMGYGDGGFWKWNNDTYPVVMSRPNCHLGASGLKECEGLKDLNVLPMSENVCQGEDDLGLYCWGPPSFKGWDKHWGGIHIYNSPFTMTNEDPDDVSLMRKSLSRLDYVDVMYAGYDGSTKNTSAAVYVEGVPPLINGMHVSRSARDGFFFYESSGPIAITNSTIDFNRGHGIAVDNTTDGRLFVNSTIINNNFGDGIWYKQRRGGIQLVKTLPNDRTKRQVSYFEEESDRIDICKVHALSPDHYFPHLIKLNLKNGTYYDSNLPPLCWMTFQLPPRLSYTYTLQFIDIINKNGPQLESKTTLQICDGVSKENKCRSERYSIPIYHHVYPQSITLKSNSQPIYMALNHDLGPYTNGKVGGDIELRFKVHASVLDKGIYGLNVTNSFINNNTGCGVRAMEIRDRTCLSNVTIEQNEGLAGFLVKDGAADIWVNGSSINHNWGDGMNVSFAGGAINFNGSTLIGNRWRGFAFHQNETLPFLPLRHEIVFKGRPSNNQFYLRTRIEKNVWGGILIGNYCTPAFSKIEPRVFINWVEFGDNEYHPSFELFSCQRIFPLTLPTIFDFSGNRIENGTGIGLRIEPAVNIVATITSNKFIAINNSALLIRNAKHPQLISLPAKVNISENVFKLNSGQFIISIGLNEDAPKQHMSFNQQNEVRSNKVINPYPHLKSRSTPYAALVVSSSNVIIHRNCFRNPLADFEIGTELSEHAKYIDASENNWGYPSPEVFLKRIFDHFNRYSLANIEVNHYAVVCNKRNPKITLLQEHFRQFKNENMPTVLGGTIFENHDLPKDIYTVTDDLHVVPGAKLTIAPGSRLEFMDGIGMLVQGELLRADVTDSNEPIIFTNKKTTLQDVKNIRLMDEEDNEHTLQGRLELFVDNQWGTVCNRSWTVHHAQMVCNQLGLIMDPEYFENWRIFPSQGDLPMTIDNIRCEEREYDITECRHDGLDHNIGASCRPTEVVGVRCTMPHWAGVRYSLLANPPTITGQTTMNNWIIENAGLFDFRNNLFSPALQIDWNYHTFEKLVIKNNFHHGVDIIYNDLTKKPAIRDAYFINNRRDGINIRSGGITIEKVHINNNGNAGIRYNPLISAPTQRDIVSWLDKKDQTDMEANNVFIVPNTELTSIEVHESEMNQRKFLVFKENEYCPIDLFNPCQWMTELEALGNEFGMRGKVVVQLVNRASNMSDEEVLITDISTGQSWSVTKNTIEFPVISKGNRLSLKYTRSYGKPQLILLILFLDTQEYLDRFVHVYESEINGNQYAISSIHYSNLTYHDGTILSRKSQEMLWFQKVNFSRNTDAVLWIYNPQHIIMPNTEIADITYNIDNCSFTENTGSIIDTHRDQFSSANIFHWRFWSNTFERNKDSSIHVHLPDSYDILQTKNHSFWMTENRFQNNTGFDIHLKGYYSFVNISSNNFTDNVASNHNGILEIAGMEKYMYLERNRFFRNHGQWMVKVNIDSHTLRDRGSEIESYIQYNYFQFNTFIKSKDDYVDMWPRSYAIGIFGLQKVDIHFNRLRNYLMDFELVAGCKSRFPAEDVLNVTLNWWSASSEAIIAQRIFDLDDWNSYILADFSPYYVTEELFLDYWWRPPIGQLAIATYAEPDVLDLKGRMYESKNMTLLTEKWHTFPFYFKADRPYRIVRDLTIMPGATLRIEKGVEVHIWPNVRILVLGNLIAEGTYWEPIRFKPINVTEYNQIKGRTPTRYKRNIETKLHQSEENYLFRMKRKSTIDPIFAEFPSLRRHDPYHQKFDLHLDGNGSYPNAGFLNIFNSTTGESVPSCDRQFTVRNAQVVCRQLGLAVENVYHWVSERWNYNPKIKLVKTYMEPRECLGTEDRLDECLLRMSGNDSQWMCMDNEHFNFIHCGSNKSLSSEYIGNWGSLAFGPVSLELGQELDNEESKLLNVEIVGGGMTHNDSFNCAALQMIRRSPIINSVNVTNSSMDAVQIISPRHSIILTRLNITNNKGQGINVLTNNLQTPTASSIIPQGPLTIPYLAPGLLEMCSAGKILNVYNRILLYYKYDSYPVDCVKVFHSTMGAISFRFLHFNMYESKTNLGRSDSLSIYSDATFKERVLIKKYAAHGFNNHEMPVQSTSGVMALHFRGTAADGIYGFLVEIAVLPNKPDAGKALEITIQHAKMYENDRGAIEYRNTGEMGPQVSIESCAIDKNGYNLYGNISTSSQAVEIHLHNTPTFKFRNNGVTRNIGGLLVTAQTSSGIGLTGIIKSNAFVQNMNSTVIGLIGNNHQNIRIINNIISLNEALYFDNVIVQEMSTNFSGNLFSNNTGIHTINTQGFSQNNKDPQLFYFNNFQDNLALGSGHQYMEHYGFLPEDEVDEFSRRPKRHVLDEGGKNIYLLEDSQFSQSQTLPYYSNSTSSMARPKRQVLTQRGISFDWWTHVGTETSRYRGTILAGNAQHKFHNNVFNDPANDYELVTSASSKFELDVIDATSNYWSYPGTPGVAAGKIRDFNDYKYLIQVQYLPVLESNTSLIDGDCPAGWFIAGNKEFKSCFLFVGASMTYTNAVNFCSTMGAFMPYLRSDDVRQKSLAAKIDYFINRDMTEQERIETYKMSQEANIWMSGINVPSIQCGRMSSKTGSIGTVNCNDLLPFVCEKGTKPYEEPVTWRYAVVFGIILISILLLFIICLTICWCYKSQQREEEHHFRKDSVRKSKRHMSKVNEWNEMKKTTMTQANQMYNNPDGFGSISQAHKNVLNSTPGYGSSGTSSARTGSSRTETSGTGTTTTGTTATGSSLLRPYTSCTSDSLTTDRYTGTAKSGGSSSFVPMQGKVSAQPNPYAEIATLRKGSTNPLILTNNPDFMQDCSCDGTESSTYSSIRGSSLTDDTSTYCEGSERTESDNCSSHTLLAKQSSTPLTTFGKPAQRPMSTFVPNASPSRSQMQNATSNPSLYYEVGQLSNAGVNLGLSKTPATPKPIPTPSTPPSFAKYQPYLQPETNKKSPHLNEVPSRSLVDLAQPKQYSNPFARGGTYKSTEHLKPLETSM